MLVCTVLDWILCPVDNLTWLFIAILSKFGPVKQFCTQKGLQLHILLIYSTIRSFIRSFNQ